MRENSHGRTGNRTRDLMSSSQESWPPGHEAGQIRNVPVITLSLKKYKTVQSFKVHFLQNSPLMQLYASTSDCKCVGNIPGSYFVNTFQLFRRILDVRSITLALSLQCWFRSREQVKISRSQFRTVWGCSSVVTLFFAKKSMTKTYRCAGAFSWRRNELLVLSFSGSFLLTASLMWRRMSMFICFFNISNSCKLYQRNVGTFWSYYAYTSDNYCTHCNIRSIYKNFLHCCKNILNTIQYVLEAK
jgi:hypothetical protein